MFYPSSGILFSVPAIKTIGNWSEVSSLIIPVSIVACNSEFVIIWSRAATIFL